MLNALRIFETDYNRPDRDCLALACFITQDGEVFHQAISTRGNLLAEDPLVFECRDHGNTQDVAVANNCPGCGLV